MNAVRPQRALFFAATAYSVFVVPLWVVARELGLPRRAVSFATADLHGYEMLFGYTLTVVAGFLIGPVSRVALLGLICVWLTARVAVVVAPFGLVHAGASALFAVGVAVLAAPKLFRGPSKPRNRVFGPVVLLLCSDAALAAVYAPWRAKLLLVGLDLYVLLLVFMGGRLIAAAAAGQFYRRGERLDQRVQPRVEGVLLVTLLLLFGCDLLSTAEALCSALALLASLLIVVRWVRWRLWTCLRAWNLVAMGVGYLWLAVGLALRASRTLPIWWLPADALHGLTVGALGSLTLLVMGRTRAMTNGVNPERSRLLLLAAVLVDVAAVLRLMAGVSRLLWRAALVVVAGSLWGVAFAILGVFLVTLPNARSSRST